MEATQVKTLEELARFINEQDEWPLVVSDIIKTNGWHDETGSEYGVCSCGARRVVLNEDGEAEVIES